MLLYGVLHSSERYQRMYLVDCLRDQAEAGWKDVEIYGQVPHLFADAYGISGLEEIKKGLEAFALETAVFRPGVYQYDLCADPEDPFGAASMGYYRHMAAAAVKLGAKMLSLNSFMRIVDGDLPERKKRAVKAVKMLSAEAGPVKILCENGGKYSAFSALKELCDLKSAVPEIQIQMNLAGALEAGEKLSDWLKAFGEDLKVISVPGFLLREMQEGTHTDGEWPKDCLSALFQSSFCGWIRLENYEAGYREAFRRCGIPAGGL